MQVSYECEIFGDETLRHICKPLISRLYNAHTAVRCSSVQSATFKTLSAAVKTTKGVYDFLLVYNSNFVAISHRLMPLTFFEYTPTKV